MRFRHFLAQIDIARRGLCGQSSPLLVFCYPMSRFSDRHVLVTAGAAGIGRAIATAFAAEGAHVHVVDIDADAIARLEETGSLGPGAQFTHADVTDEAAVAAVFETRRALGGLDVLVNCAGIKGPTALVEDVAFADWRQCLAVNLDAAFLCCHHGVPLLRESAAGSVINLSSTAGWHGYGLRAPYAAAKWGVIGLTKSLAMELGPDGIRVNAICPGSVSGDRMDRVIREEALERGVSEEAVREGYTRGVSLRSFIEPEDIADTALFLASPAARRITGQAVSVDGHLESFASMDR